MGLLDSTRTIPRISPSCVVCGDLLVLCLAIPSIFLILANDKHDGADDEPYPWGNTDFLSLSVTWAICGLRFILLVWSCVDCCITIRQPSRPASRTTPPDSTSELRDVPPTG
ncbi:hypothetical protein F5Y05DRAFT_90354 [Hypoxylon sp. FL0543]|nr:hypothetical protein F5Y05DRAFT_90354 [Hypoxylon sp. FL0543]